uniref:Uncharacterized protein n=1 Tax=Oryza glumipatula TaxID=40148 RepID=A0A0E0B568_9ORYZ
MQVDIAARDAAGFVEVDHGAGAGSGILRWAVGSVFAVFWVALIIGLVGGEKDPVPAVRAVTRSPHDIYPSGPISGGAPRLHRTGVCLLESSAPSVGILTALDDFSGLITVLVCWTSMVYQ